MRDIDRDVGQQLCEIVAGLNVVPPFSLFGERINQKDVRAGKIFTFGKTRIQANVDLYNLSTPARS